jgi:hypothetical protein
VNQLHALRNRYAVTGLSTLSLAHHQVLDPPTPSSLLEDKFIIGAQAVGLQVSNAVVVTLRWPGTCTRACT